MDEIICQRNDCHDDAHPEFAPRVIMQSCERAAVVMWTDEPGGGAMVVCVHHAQEMMTYCVDNIEGFSARLLTDTDRAQFAAGEAYANATHLDEDTALRAFHEGTLAAGLHTPEYSPPAFDVGWEWALVKRIQDIVWAAEQRMELHEQGLYEREQMR